MRTLFLLVSTLLFLSSACMITDYFGIDLVTPTPIPPTITITSTITASSTATSTPNPPTLTPTVTSSATSTPTFTLTPTQELPPARFPQTPVPVIFPIPYPEGQTRILLVGVDNRVPENIRADSITLIALNSQQETASILSIPPQLFVNIPGTGMQRINTALNFGGVGKLLDTIEYNLGVRADHYLVVDIYNFLKIEDAIGPVAVNVAAPLSSRCDVPGRTSGWCSVQPGLRIMEKDTALWYVRDTAGGEFERMRRGREVLVAIFNRVMDLRWPGMIPDLFAAYIESVETDLTSEDLIMLSTIAVPVYFKQAIFDYAFTPIEAVPGTLPGKEFVLFIDQKAAVDLLRRSIFQP